MQYVDDTVARQVAAMKNSILSEQSSMISQAIGNIGMSNNSVINKRSGDINFNVEHYHNDNKTPIEQTAKELGHFANQQKVD